MARIPSAWVSGLRPTKSGRWQVERRRVTKATTARAISVTLPSQKPKLKLTEGQRHAILKGKGATPVR